MKSKEKVKNYSWFLCVKTAIKAVQIDTKQHH